MALPATSAVAKGIVRNDIAEGLAVSLEANAVLDTGATLFSIQPPIRWPYFGELLGGRAKPEWSPR